MIINTSKFSPLHSRNIESLDSPEYLKTSTNKKPPPKSKTPNFQIKTEPNDNNKEENARNFAFVYGNSYEAPTYMINKNSIIDKQSYNNLFLEESEKWPFFSKLNNQLTNMNEFKISGHPNPRKKGEKSMQIFKF